MRFLPHIQILFHSFFKLVGTVVEDYSPHGMGGKSNYLLPKEFQPTFLKVKIF